MTHYWLLKSEPTTWSWEEQVKAGEKGTFWSGVRNHQAKKNLLAMKKGDRAFFYHTDEEKRIVGIVDIIREAYADPTAEKNEPWVAVDVKAAKPLPKPITLAQIKAEKKLAKMALVNSARLSVQPVTPEEWEIIGKMGGF